MNSALLAYSGGVDSTLLLKTLSLSGIRALAVASASPSTPAHDISTSKEMAESMGMELRIIETAEFANQRFLDNPPDRCFFCKDELFERLSAIAMSEGYEFVLDGSNTDDTNDHRPGLKAGKSRGVRSPLIEAEISKADVREISRELGLQTWDKPSSPCLASRFPYGTRITEADIKRVATAEELLRSMGFSELRVRHYGETAKIEVPSAEMERVFDGDRRLRILGGLKALGYKFVSVDLEGFRSGKLNDALTVK